MCSFCGYRGIFNVTQVPFHNKRRMAPHQDKRSVCPKREKMEFWKGVMSHIEKYYSRLYYAVYVKEQDNSSSFVLLCSCWQVITKRVFGGETIFTIFYYFAQKNIHMLNSISETETEFTKLQCKNLLEIYSYVWIKKEKKIT